jgi:hypothetical protein
MRVLSTPSLAITILAVFICTQAISTAGQTLQRSASPRSNPPADPQPHAPELHFLHEIPGVTMIREGLFRVNERPRPLDAAAQLLERKLGVPISYEDPEWSSSLELDRGTLDVVLPGTPLAAQLTTPKDVIEAVLLSHSSFGNRRHFVLKQLEQSEFVIVPTNDTGSSAPYASPLDLKVSFPMQERTLFETIELLFQRIYQAGKGPPTGRHPFTGQEQFAWDGPTISGIYSTSYFRATRVRVGAIDESGRDVLARALRTAREQKFSWNMRNTPGKREYFIDIKPVQIEVSTPNGPKLQWVMWK